MSQEWFRSWRNAPKDEKWLAVAAEAGVPRSLVVAVVWCLLDHGGSRPFAERGSVEGINARVLAAWLECSTDDVERVMAALIEFGFMTETTIRHWDDYQPAREDNSKERTRAYRERKKANGTDPHPPGGLHEPTRKMKRDVTHGDAKVTPRDAPESESESESEKKESSSARAHTREAPAVTTTDDFYKFGTGLLASLGEPSPQAVLDALLGKHHGKVQWAFAKLRHVQTARHQRKYYQRLRDELVLDLVPRTKPPEQVFVVEDTPAWTAWTERRKGSPPVTQLGRKRGWYFPTEYPPPLEVMS